MQNETLDKIVEQYAPRLESNRQEKANIVNEIAIDFEDTGVPLDEIVREIKKRLQKYEDFTVLI
jgi:hypothetical protein